MIKQALAIAASTLVLAGCAGRTIPFDATQVGGMEQRTLVAVTQAAPGFMPMRATGAALGMMGTAMELAESKTYAAEHNIVDPSSLIEDALTHRLQDQYRLKTGERLDLTDAEGKAPIRPPRAPSMSTLRSTTGATSICR